MIKRKKDMMDEQEKKKNKRQKIGIFVIGSLFGASIHWIYTEYQRQKAKEKFEAEFGSNMQKLDELGKEMVDLNDEIEEKIDTLITSAKGSIPTKDPKQKNKAQKLNTVKDPETGLKETKFRDPNSGLIFKMVGGS